MIIKIIIKIITALFQRIEQSQYYDILINNKKDRKIRICEVSK